MLPLPFDLFLRPFDLFLRPFDLFLRPSIYLCELRYDPVMGIVQLSYLYVDIKYAVLI